MLEENEIPYRYREYRDDPLDPAEIHRVLGMLGVGPREVLRTRDRAYREAGLTGEEDEEELVRLMSEHPTLLQRPIGVAGGRAVLGRPPERILELARETE